MDEQTGDVDPLVGTVIQDRYRVIARIGSGGTGVVYLVEHTRLGRRYALKVLDEAMSRKQVSVARFHREARAAAAIGDEHVVDVVDMGNLDRGAPYLVMELLEGRDLGDELTLGPMPIVRAVDIATQCCEALGEAHKKGIVHRDIKPENIFLTKRRDGSEFVKILDFGISKILEAANDLEGGSLTRTGTAVGTPRYMSIEQIDGFNDVDARTDQYAMGVVLFEMLIGRPPFDAPTYGALVRKVASEAPPSLVALRSDIPLALEEVVHRALDRKREQRFASMEEFAQALAPFAGLGGAPKLAATGTAFRPTFTPRVWERPARGATSRFLSAKILTAVGLMGAAALGALVYVYFRSYSTEESTSASALTRSAYARVLRPYEPALGGRSPGAPAPGSGSNPTPALRTEPSNPSNRGAILPSTLPRAGAPQGEAAKTKLAAAASTNARAGERRPPSSDALKHEASRRPLQDRRGNLPAMPESRASTSPAVAKRGPIVAPMRTVKMHNALQTNVKVTFTCGSASITATVPAMNQASVTVQKESCQVSCAGIGGPVCPTLLGADTESMFIR